ncbi:MAG: hypothetical protein JWQ23_2765 [Herminiimonas sp.]|nr:hypothetical protein [Herminiimonas sp.]
MELGDINGRNLQSQAPASARASSNPAWWGRFTRLLARTFDPVFKTKEALARANLRHAVQDFSAQLGSTLGSVVDADDGSASDTRIELEIGKLHKAVALAEGKQADCAILISQAAATHVSSLSPDALNKLDNWISNPLLDYKYTPYEVQSDDYEKFRTFFTEFKMALSNEIATRRAGPMVDKLLRMNDQSHSEPGIPMSVDELRSKELLEGLPFAVAKLPEASQQAVLKNLIILKADSLQAGAPPAFVSRIELLLQGVEAVIPAGRLSLVLEQMATGKFNGPGKASEMLGALLSQAIENDTVAQYHQKLQKGWVDRIAKLPLDQLEVVARNLSNGPDSPANGTHEYNLFGILKAETATLALERHIGNTLSGFTPDCTVQSSKNLWMNLINAASLYNDHRDQDAERAEGIIRSAVSIKLPAMTTMELMGGFKALASPEAGPLLPIQSEVLARIAAELENRGSQVYKNAARELFEGLGALTVKETKTCKPVVDLMFSFALKVGETLSLESTLATIDDRGLSTLQHALNSKELKRDLAALHHLLMFGALAWLGEAKAVISSGRAELTGKSGAESKIAMDQAYAAISLLLDTLTEQVKAATVLPGRTKPQDGMGKKVADAFSPQLDAKRHLAVEAAMKKRFSKVAKESSKRAIELP